MSAGYGLGGGIPQMYPQQPFQQAYPQVPFQYSSQYGAGGVSYGQESFVPAGRTKKHHRRHHRHHHQQQQQQQQGHEEAHGNVDGAQSVPE